MTSMFERHVKNLLKEVGKNDLQPIKNLSDAIKVHQFIIIRKKKGNFLSLLWKQPDIPTEFSLMDLLEPSSSIPETVSTEPCSFRFTGFKKLKGGVDVEVNTGLEVSTSGEASKFQESSFQFQFVTVPPQTWTDLQKRGVLEKEPEFLTQCRIKGENLYVVTEILKLTDSTRLDERGRVGGGGNVSIPWNPYLKGQVQGEGLQMNKEMLTLPKGLVVAYKRKQLVLKNDGWAILHVSDDGEENTFQDSNILPIGRIEEPISRNFKLLQQEISQKMEALASFPKDLQYSVFHNILAMLGDRAALQHLMDMLEENPSGHLDGPGGTILDGLQKNTEDLWVGQGYHIRDILEALMVLSDTQHDLLAQSMKMRILAQQRDLVRSILEPNFKYPWRIPFTLKPELLALLQNEGMAITFSLLEDCGLMMKLNSPKVTWDLEAKRPLSALYATLSVLQQLANP